MNKNESDGRERIAKFRITIEPVGFLLITSGVIQGIVHENSFLKKACLVNFELNATSCNTPRNGSGQVNITENQDNGINDRIQSYVSMLFIWSSLIETLPSIVFVLCLGPWSNKYGRKPLMISPILGYVASIMIYMLVNYIDSLPAEYLLLGSLPVGLMGGFNTLMMATNSSITMLFWLILIYSSYLVDITEEKSRTLRLSIFTGMIMFSVPVASYVSVQIYRFGGEWAVWNTSLGLSIIALVYLIFFVTDSRGQQPVPVVEEKPAEKTNQSFDTRNQPSLINSITQCFVVTFRRRDGYKRIRLVLMLVMICLTSFALASASMEYLYARKRFAWDAPDFAMFGVVASTVPAIGSLFILPLLSGFLGIRDWYIGIASLLGNIGANLTIAFAINPLMFYLSSIGNLLIAGIGIVINSSISKIVDTEDLVYVYSVIAGLNAVIPLASSAGAKLVYVATLNVFPGCVFVFGAGLGFILLLLSIMAIFLQELDESKCDPVPGASHTP